MTTESYIFLAGASRGVGREIAKCLREQKQPVKALLRSKASRAELEAMGIKVAQGDALDVAALEKGMLGNEPIKAVISTISGWHQNGSTADNLGNKNLIDAALKAKVQKFILVSSIGVGNSAVALSAETMQSLGSILAEKGKSEQYLMDSGLNYTIIRPGWLKSQPATGNGILTENFQVVGAIHRADVAQLVCRCLFSEGANNKVFSTLDRNMIYGQPKVEEFNLI